MTGRSKKVISVILTAAVLSGAAAGISVAVRKTTSSSGTALVISVNDISYSGYMMDTASSMSGYVTTDAMQNVYLTDAETVSKVCVKEGQTVRKGDVLLEYDTSRTALGLEKEKLNLQQIQLKMEVARKNLETLKTLKPVSDADGGDYGGGFGEEGEVENEENSSKTYANLTGDAAALNETEEGAGTQGNPLRYLCLEQTTIQPSFLEMLQKKAQERKMETVWFSLEVHAENSPDSPILRMWLGDSLSLADQLARQNTLKIDLAVSEAYDRLDGKAVAFNEDTAEENLGSREHPYRYLVRNGADITLEDSFFSMLKEKNAGKDTCYFLLEAHEGDKVTGKLLTWKNGGTTGEKMWGRDALQLKEDKEICVSFAGDGKPGIREQKDSAQEASPTEEPSVTPTESPSEIPAETPAVTPEPTPSATPPAPTAEPSGTPPEAEPSGTETQDGSSVGAGVQAPSGQKAEADAGTAAQTASLVYTGGIPSAELAFAGSLRVSNIFTDSESSGSAGKTNGGSAGNTSDRSSGLSGGSELISPDASYTKEEIAESRKDQEKALKDLELDERESRLKIQMTQEALDSGKVTARLDGTVIKAGDPQSPPQDGSAFLQVSGSEGLYVKGGLPELLLGKVRNGDTVTVTSWQTGGTYQAEVRDISPYPDTSGVFDTGYSDSVSQSYYPFIARIAEKGADLKEGESLNIQLASPASAQDFSETGNTISIDQAFVRDENGKKYVMKRGEDGKLVKQYIETGKLNGGSYEVKTGITAEDWIAFPYGKTAVEGTKTREASMEELVTS